MDDVSHQAERANSGYDVVASFRQCVEHAPGMMLSLTAGQEMKDLVIAIVQHGVISGKVLNQDGEPVPGMVAAMQAVYERGARRLISDVTAAIGPNGEYTVDDLPPGRYYLRSINGYMFSSPEQGKPSPEADVATYYPGELDESKAVAVEVKPGEETRGADILVRRVRAFSVRGAVALPPGGGPTANMYATLAPKEGAAGLNGNFARVAANGAFEFRNVEPGAYVLSCSAAAPTLFGRREVIVSAADVEGVNLSPIQGVAVAGTVKVEGVNSGTWPTLALAALDGRNTFGMARFDSSGAFTFSTSVAPSEYEVRLNTLPPGMYVKSIRYGAQDALHGSLDLTGGAAGSLDIVLSSKVAAITGKVRNAKDEAAPGVLVTAWPRKAELMGGVHSASTDQNGNFEIADLGPGDYFVAAWEDIDPGLAEYPEFLTRFQNQAAAAKLEEGGRGSADVKPIPREKIASEMAKLP
jgi:hypothetical protein